MSVNIHEAKTHLSRLVDRAAAGEEIVIARAGKPVARLVALEPPVKYRELGLWKGKVWLAPDFDKADDEMIRLFEEGD
jgi:prevent-host-death family protein